MHSHPDLGRRRFDRWRRHPLGWRVFGIGAGLVLALGAGVGPAFATGRSASQAPAGTSAQPLTCSSTGVADECRAALAYASANHPGSGTATVLKVEADVERHGGTTGHRVFDIRTLAPNGTIYVEHVYRNEASDTVWWESTAENQSGGGSGSGSGDGNGNGSGQGSGHSLPPQISSAQAASAAERFVEGRYGVQVMGVKKERLTSTDGKDVYKVKLQLEQGGRKHGTTVAWVDATSSSASVTAVQGDGIRYRASSLISLATAERIAEGAAGGSVVTSASLHGDHWRFYEIKVRVASGKQKVWLSAATGVVTQVLSSGS